MPQKAFHIWVSGQVQGVFYRARTVEMAQSLNLTGWVRNRSDGRVEIIAEGEPEALERLLAWCRKGPPAAQVEAVKWQEISTTGRYNRFAMRWEGD